MAEILYFARLAESLGLKSENLVLPANCNTVSDLVEILSARGEPFTSEFNGDTQLLVAINQEMRDWSTEIDSSDEIGFFPPVTGG